MSEPILDVDTITDDYGDEMCVQIFPVSNKIALTSQEEHGGESCLVFTPLQLDGLIAVLTLARQGCT